MDVNKFNPYMFLFGLWVGGRTNFFGNCIITVLMTYIINPNLYSQENIDRGTNWLWGKFSSFFSSKKTQ